MNDTERIVLREIAESLNKSTKTEWKTGFFDDWVDHAKKMRAVIKTAVPIIEKLVSEEDNKDKS